MLLIPSVTVGHAFYTAPLPSNTIYADDFENYTTTTCTATWTNNIATCLVGWGQFDALGGKIGVNNTLSYSCCHSLYTQSNAGTANNKYDVDRRIGLFSNTTTTIQVSYYFAFSTNINNPNGGTQNNFHFAIETWDHSTHWECLTFFYATGTANSGVYPDWPISTSTPFPLTGTATEPTDSNNRATAWDTGASENAQYFHHVVATCNISTHKWVDFVLDGMDYTKTLGGQGMRSITPDTSFQSFQRANGLRLEWSVQSGSATQVASYGVWIDNVIVTDVTPGQPNIIQFGLVGYSAWIPLIMAMAGVNTTLSSWSLVIRLFKKNDGSTLRGLLVAHTKMIVAMNIAVVAFLIVLVIGSIYLPGTCPAGAVCNG